MSISIKLLVEFNAEKYSIFVESEYKFVTFKRVSNEIITQLNQKISFKTHLFELFDPDFGEYVLVTNENQLIDNLSRIRVKRKDTTPLNNESEVDIVSENLDQFSISEKSLSKPSSDMTDKELNKFCDYLFASNNANNFTENDKNNKLVAKQQTAGTSAKDLNDFIENNLSEKTKDLSKYLFNNNETSEKLVIKDINVNKLMATSDEHRNGSTDDTVAEASNQQTIRNSGVSSAEPQEEAVNYLDLEESNNYKLSESCPQLYHKTFVEKFRKQMIVVIRFRYEDFKAIHMLLEFLDLNRRCFKKNPSNKDPSNPKWNQISILMVNNGFDDWTYDRCRDAFNNALDLYRKSLDKCPDYDTAAKVNPLFAALHIFDMKFIISLQEFNVIRDLRDLFGRKLSKFSYKSGFSQRNFNSNLSMVPRSSATDTPSRQRDRIFKNSAKIGSNMSLQSMSNGIDNKTKAKNKSQIDRLKLKNIGLKVDDYLIVTFKSLAKCVDTISAQFGYPSRNTHFWDLVSNQMKAIGYKTYLSEDCYHMFTEHVCDYYSLALTYSSNVTNAKELYPLFEFIHSMDLNQCLSPYSYERITELRQKFEKKSQFFNQMFVK